MKTSRSETEVTVELIAAKRERDVIAFLLRLWDEKRMDGHKSRTATVVEMARRWSEIAGVIPEEVRMNEVSRFVDSETRLLFTAPELFIKYQFTRNNVR